jgi:hypothetical protein
MGALPGEEVRVITPRFSEGSEGAAKSYFENAMRAARARRATAGSPKRSRFSNGFYTGPSVPSGTCMRYSCRRRKCAV